jgi:hypothetical protein
MKKKKSVLVTISKKEFDSIPQKRAGYILACGIVQLLFVGDRVYEYLVGPVHDYAVYALVAGFFIAYCAMYIQLIFAMRIMQFHWLLIIPTCVIVFFPIFGVMPLGLMDRRIAENWDSAQEKQDQYRQRIKDEDGDRPSEK